MDPPHSFSVYAFLRETLVELALNIPQIRTVQLFFGGIGSNVFQTCRISSDHSIDPRTDPGAALYRIVPLISFPICIYAGLRAPQLSSSFLVPVRRIRHGIHCAF